MWPLKQTKRRAKGRKKKRTLKQRRLSSQLRVFVFRRKVLQISSVAIAVVGLSCVGAWAYNQGHADRLVDAVDGYVEHAFLAAGLSIQEVFVNGRRQTQLPEIAQVVGVRRGDSIIDFDPAAARQRLLAMGWIKNATVTRRLPNLVLIEIVEREPLALWQKDGRLALIGHDGAEITRKNLGRFAKLPIVVGRGSREHARDLIGLLSSQPSLFAMVEAAIRIGNRRWNLRMKNGIEINLPEEEAEKAWRKLAELEIEHGVFKRDVAAIDLRFPDRLVVRMTEQGAKKRRNPGKDT